MIESLLTRWLPNVDWQEIGYASLDTLNMLGGATLFTVLLGLPLGVLLFLTGPLQMFEQRLRGPVVQALAQQRIKLSCTVVEGLAHKFIRRTLW